MNYKSLIVSRNNFITK